MSESPRELWRDYSWDGHDVQAGLARALIPVLNDLTSLPRTSHSVSWGQ